MSVGALYVTSSGSNGDHWVVGLFLLVPPPLSLPVFFLRKTLCSMYVSYIKKFMQPTVKTDVQLQLFLYTTCAFLPAKPHVICILG